VGSMGGMGDMEKGAYIGVGYTIKILTLKGKKNTIFKLLKLIVNS